MVGECAGGVGGWWCRGVGQSDSERWRNKRDRANERLRIADAAILRRTLWIGDALGRLTGLGPDRDQPERYAIEDYLSVCNNAGWTLTDTRLEGLRAAFTKACVARLGADHEAWMANSQPDVLEDAENTMAAAVAARLSAEARWVEFAKAARLALPEAFVADEGMASGDFSSLKDR